MFFPFSSVLSTISSLLWLNQWRHQAVQINICKRYNLNKWQENSNKIKHSKQLSQFMESLNVFKVCDTDDD